MSEQIKFFRYWIDKSVCMCVIKQQGDDYYRCGLSFKNKNDKFDKLLARTTSEGRAERNAIFLNKDKVHDKGLWKAIIERINTMDEVEKKYIPEWFLRSIKKIEV